MRLRAGDGIGVKCTECAWERHSASNLAGLDFIFDHEHRYATVTDDYGHTWSLDSEQHDPGSFVRLRMLKEAVCPTPATS